MVEMKEEKIIDEEAQMFIDIISMNPTSKKYQKYRDILRDKHGIDFDDISRDDKYIATANLTDIKTKSDFLSFDNYIHYAKKIFKLRGLAHIQPNHIEGIVTISQAEKLGKKLGFKINHREYAGSGNYASHDLIDTITMPNEVDVNTFIHEIGHHYDHYESNSYEGLAKTITYASSPYHIGKSNEVFAENFLHYFIAPIWLQKELRMVYDELDKNILPLYKQEINSLIKNKFSKGGLIAPNGKPSNLTPEQYKLVRTSAFKKWFGDWENDPENASKVVDGNGEPMVVYHGSISHDIDVFDRNKSKRTSSGLKEFGTYFATNKKLAKAYKDWAELDSSYKKELDKEIYKLEQIIYEVRNNREFDILDNKIKDLKKVKAGGKIYEVFLNIKKMASFDAKGKTNIGAWNNLEVKASYKWATNRDAMDFLKEGKFGVEKVDGIEAINIVDAFVQTEDLKKELIGNVYLVFDSHNIKLADGTNNTFDGDNPDIRFEDGGGVGDVETGIIREFPIRKLIAYEWKLKEVAEEIKRGELSYSKNEPSLVSYVPELKKYLILDGHHRILEQKHDGKKVIKARISKYVPKTYNLSSNVVNLSSPLFKQGGNIESEEIKTNNMNNLNIESFYEYAKGEILNYLNDTLGVKSLNDWKFNYKGSEYFIEIFPQYNDKTNTLTRADFSIQDKSGREVGEITFDPKSGSKMFTSKSDFFGLHHKFEDGGGIKPIRELGTGHNVYFETPYYRLNEIGRSGFKYILLMNEKDDANGVPFYNYESNDLESAYKIATRFNEIYPKGVPNAVKIDVLIDDIITDNKRKQMKTDISAYKNPYEINRAIEKLIDEKGDDRDLYSPSEIEFISYYSGYGGLEKFGATGKGILYEYFTPDELCKKMWGLAYKHGYGTIGDKSVFEPSVGVGNFLKYAPKNVRVVANEINEYSKTICQLLHPKAEIIQQYFEQNFIRKNSSIKSNLSSLPQYSLVIGNPPYGKIGGTYMGMGEDDYSHAQNFVQYFIFRGLDLLHSGGLLIYIVGAEQKSGGTMFLDSVLSKTKKAIFDKADLVDAYRLPVKMFERTSVSSEIVVFKKR